MSNQEKQQHMNPPHQEPNGALGRREASSMRLSEADIIQHNNFYALAMQQKRSAASMNSFQLSDEAGSRLQQDIDNRQLLLASNVALQALGLGAVLDQLRQRENFDIQQLRIEQSFRPSTQPFSQIPFDAARNGNQELRSTEASETCTSLSSAVDVKHVKHKHDAESQGTRDGLRSVNVPCRARRMPLDHNFKTAHFAIPEDVQHGADLVCSYSACRDGGVKFRFCSWCRIPVAKRNFRMRHDHTGEPKPEGGIKSLVDFNNGCIPSHVVGKNKDKGTTNSSAVAKTRPEAPDGDNKPAARLGSVKSNEERLPDPRLSRGAVLTEEERRKLWATLIVARPSANDGDAMTLWIRRVLKVSNPLTSPEEVKATVLSLFREPQVTTDESGTTSSPTDHAETSTNQTSSNDSSSDSSRFKTEGARRSDSKRGTTTEDIDSSATGGESSDSSNDSSSTTTRRNRTGSSNQSSSVGDRFDPEGSSNESSSDSRREGFNVGSSKDSSSDADDNDDDDLESASYDAETHISGSLAREERQTKKRRLGFHV